MLGKPGSGKGTQGKILADKHNLVYISTGAMLRQEVANDTEIGRIAKPYMDKGQIVPDEIPIKLIEQKIESNPNTEGFVFKGFPRTIVQAYILDGLLQREDMELSGMIEMRISTLEAVKRLSTRAHTDRARPYDMTTDLIVDRLEQYRLKTLSVNEYYKKQGKFHSVKATGSTEEVLERLSQQIKEITRMNY
ncbi:MAG: nucleoside monophosphate kinase [bacterium]